MANFNTNGKFDVNKWIQFMNTAIQNIDETLSTKNLRDSLLWKNNLAYRVSTFDSGWQLRHSLYDLEFINQDKVLVKCEPEKELRIITKDSKNKQSHFLLKKFTKFAIYYPKTNQVREIDMSEYADLGLKKYIIK
jgi:hypothetical protein